MRNVLLSVFCFFIVLITISEQGYGQQSDTTAKVQELQTEEEQLQSFHSDRSVGKMFMPKTGLLAVPEPKEYYVHPFMAQKHLEMALADYYEEVKEEKSLLFRFINTIAPYINNQFEFAVYRIYDLPIVERDQPMLDPQLIEKQKKQ